MAPEIDNLDGPMELIISIDYGQFFGRARIRKMDNTPFSKFKNGRALLDTQHYYMEIISLEELVE